MSVASKNLFDLLGNDPDEEPQAPVRPVDKAAPRHGKRAEGAPKDTGAASSTAATGRGGRGGRRDNNTGSERAFQDRDVGRGANRGRPTDDNVRSDRHSNTLGGGREQRGRGPRGRGGRGGRGGNFDRHSRTGVTDSDKQASKGWGDETGTGEWRDEQAGDAQAAEERKQGFGTDADAPKNAEGEAPPTENGAADADLAAEPEPEKQKTLADWQAEQEEKRRALGGDLQVRKPNEGSGKTPEGKALGHDEAEAFIVGSGGKQKRERERKERGNQLVLEHDYATREAPTGGRGGRGGRGRGGSGRGTDSPRGQRGTNRGDRGGRGGAVRGARGGATPNISDTGAFPSLGGS